MNRPASLLVVAVVLAVGVLLLKAQGPTQTIQSQPSSDYMLFNGYLGGELVTYRLSPLTGKTEYISGSRGGTISGASFKAVSSY